MEFDEPKNEGCLLNGAGIADELLRIVADPSGAPTSRIAVAQVLLTYWPRATIQRCPAAVNALRQVVKDRAAGTPDRVAAAKILVWCELVPVSDHAPAAG